MTTKSFVDADIIDYPELANIVGGYGIVDAEGRGYLPVPFGQPDRVGQGRRPLSEVQERLRSVLGCWALRSFHALRGGNMSLEDTMEVLQSYVPVALSASSAIKAGHSACLDIFGVSVPTLGQNVQDHVRALMEHSLEAAKTAVHYELQTFFHLGRAYSRSLSFDRGLYAAFHGRSSDDLENKIADAFNPLPNEQHFPLPIAAHLSFITGINMADLWQDQWIDRLLLGTAAALNPWSTFKPAQLLPEHYYVLFRCAVAAEPEIVEGGDREVVQRFIAHQIDNCHGDREHFLHNAGQDLSEAGLLTDPPRTVAELIRRCMALDGPDDTPRWFTIPTLRRL
jgi:hypothetical protein